MDIYDQEAYSVDVGTRLRQLREERKLSMRALATASGLSANALSMIERGKTSPSVSTLYKLADAMGVPITTFFGEQTTRQQVIFIRAQKRPRVPFSRGIWEGLGGEQFSGRVEPFMLTLESGASSGLHNMIHSGHEFVGGQRLNDKLGRTCLEHLHGFVYIPVARQDNYGYLSVSGFSN